jgi:hypothetical protein
MKVRVLHFPPFKGYIMTVKQKAYWIYAQLVRAVLFPIVFSVRMYEWYKFRNDVISINFGIQHSFKVGQVVYLCSQVHAYKIIEVTETTFKARRSSK